MGVRVVLLDRDAAGDRAARDHGHRGQLGRATAADRADQAGRRGPATGRAGREQARALGQPGDQRQRDHRATGVAEGESGPVDQLLGGTGAEFEFGGDLLVGETAELMVDQRSSLGGRKVSNRGEHRGEAFPLLDHVIGRSAVPGRYDEVQMAVFAVVSHIVEGRVADHRVKPGTGIDLAVAAERTVGLDQRFLDHVFGPVTAGDRTGVSDQGVAVAPDQLVEGWFDSAAEELEQPLV